MYLKFSSAAAKALADSIRAGVDYGNIPAITFLSEDGNSLVLTVEIETEPPFHRYFHITTKENP